VLLVSALGAPVKSINEELITPIGSNHSERRHMANSLLFTMPVKDPELRSLKIAAAKAGVTMVAMVRRCISRGLPEFSQEDAETWDAVQTQRAKQCAAKREAQAA
jgi:hypothetical protein